ncbi:MAG: ribosome silencing factor [Anaerovoracaceae bacterium]|jgi:ribosome-associated protein
MNNKEIALKTAAVLSAKKAKDLMVIDVTERSSFADYLVLATGSSERQVGTLVKEVTDELGKEGIFAKNVEGKQSSGWILMDYGDIIVNIFTEEQRNHYNIEKIWGDCCLLDIEE